MKLTRLLGVLVLIVAACETAPDEAGDDDGGEPSGPDRDPNKFGFCSSSFNGVCDEPIVGTGQCDAGADYYDCGTCPPEWVGDGYCDDPMYCPPGTDSGDCGGGSAPDCLAEATASGIPADAAQALAPFCASTSRCPGANTCQACVDLAVPDYNQQVASYPPYHQIYIDLWMSLAACFNQWACEEIVQGVQQCIGTTCKHDPCSIDADCSGGCSYCSYNGTCQ